MGCLEALAHYPAFQVGAEIMSPVTPFPTWLRSGYGSLNLILHHRCCFDYPSWDLPQQLIGKGECNVVAGADDTPKGLLDLGGWKVIIYSLASQGATTESQLTLNAPLLESEQD